MPRRSQSTPKQEKSSDPPKRFRNPETRSVAHFLFEDPGIRDRVSFANSYEYLQSHYFRLQGPKETPEGISFWDNELDTEQLDAVIASIADTAPPEE